MRWPSSRSATPRRRGSTMRCVVASRVVEATARARRHSSTSHAGTGFCSPRRTSTAALVGPDGRPRRQPRRRGSTIFAAPDRGRTRVNPVFNMDAAATLSPVALFLQADIVVKVVMVGLLLASVWTWTIILASWRRFGRTRKEMRRGSSATSGRPRTSTPSTRREAARELPTARVFAAGVAEWRRSTAGGQIDRDGTRERLATTMGAAVAEEVDALVGPAQHPRDGRLGGAVRRAVRHRVGDHAQLHRHRQRSRIRRSRSSRRALRKRCSRPRSGCSRRSRR